MRRTLFTVALPTLFMTVALIASPIEGFSAGLKTTFVRVSLDNLRIGGTYNIREMANLPLAVYNTGDAPISLQVEPMAPISGEAREGYEPIPDPAWITFRQDHFDGVEPGRPAMTDVVISIPDDGRYLGRKYQVMIWSHTVGGGLIACGLKSEVLFTTSPLRTEPPKAIGILPTELIIPDVEAGKPFRVKEEASGVTLKVFNPFDEDRTVTVESVPAGSSPFELREGYSECPDPRMLELSEGTITVPGGGDETIEVVVRVPAGKRTSGKRYMFTVAVTEVGRNEPSSYAAAYVTVK